MDSSGSYTYMPAGFDGSQMAWPVPCHLELVYNTIDNQGVGGPSLTIDSAQGLPTTYARDITITATGPATVTVTPTISPSSVEVTSSQTSSAHSVIETTSSSTVSKQSTNTPIPLPTRLSTGAKAGIGVGVAIGSLLVLAVIAFAVLQLKKLKKLKDRLSLFDDRDVPYTMQTTFPAMEQRRPGSKSEVTELDALRGGEEEVPHSHELEAPTSR